MTVRVGVEGAAKGLDKAQLGKAIGQGLQRGITQVAIESAAQKAGVDPLTTALTSRAITGALEGFLTSGPGVGNKAGGAMKGIFDAYTKSTLNTLSLGGAPEAGNPYSQAVYASKVKDFGDIVRSRGLSQALETYATGIFTRDFLDSIVKQGGIGDMITGKAKVVPYDGSLSEYQGKNVKLIYTDKAKGEYFVTDLSGSAFIGEKKGNVYREGEFGIGPDGKFGLLRGNMTVTNSDGSTTKLIVTNLGGPEEIILPAEGISIDDLPEKKDEKAVRILPRDKDTPIRFNEEGDVIDGILEFQKDRYRVTMKDGMVPRTSIETADLDRSDLGLTAFERANRFLQRFEQEDSPLEGPLGFNYKLLREVSRYHGTDKPGGDVVTDEQRKDIQQRWQSIVDQELFKDSEEIQSLSGQQDSKIPATEQPTSTLVLMHGTLAREDEHWADHLKGVSLAGERFNVQAITWNVKGNQDNVPGNGFLGPNGYLNDPKTRAIVTQTVDDSLDRLWRDTQAKGIPLDIVAHSGGATIIEDRLKDSKNSFIKVRNLYTIADPRDRFGGPEKRGISPADETPGLTNVENWRNFYNPKDIFNQVYDVAGGASKAAVMSTPIGPIVFGPNPKTIGERPIGPIGDDVPQVKDVTINIKHEKTWNLETWQDGKFKKQLEENWKH